MSSSCRPTYDAVAAPGAERFDLVYTGIRALCWLPDSDRWAEVVYELLAPGGRLFIREGHPMLSALDDARPDGLLVVEHPYFERRQAGVYTVEGTYVASDATFEHNTTHGWNHGLGEIVTALLSRGLQITGLVEHDSIPWEGFPGQMDALEGWRVSPRRSTLALAPQLHPAGDEAAHLSAIGLCQAGLKPGAP
jgi:SAM-dependent methyltransferase